MGMPRIARVVWNAEGMHRSRIDIFLNEGERKGYVSCSSDPRDAMGRAMPHRESTDAAANKTHTGRRCW